MAIFDKKNTLYKYEEIYWDNFMGLKAGLDLLQQARNATSKHFVKKSQGILCPEILDKVKNTSILDFSKSINDDLFIRQQKLPLSNKIKEINTINDCLYIKPSEFRNILESRTDIIEKLINEINTPEKLLLYDMSFPILKEKNLSEKEILRFFNNVFRDKRSFGAPNVLLDLEAKIELLPKLMKDNYDIDFLSKLPINSFNKKYLESLLKKETALYSKYGKNMDIKTWRNQVFNEILRYVDGENIKYVEECLEITGRGENLVFWNENTSRFLRECFADIENDPRLLQVLEPIYRNNLTYNDVKEIVGTQKLSLKSASSQIGHLFEFKNFGKLKNVGFSDLDNLSLTEQKSLLKGLITATPPSTFLFDDNGRNVAIYLAKEMKIYREMRSNFPETFQEDYYKTVSKLIDLIKRQDRDGLGKTSKLLKDNYMVKNPIPSLLSDLSAFPVQREIINGKAINVIYVPKSCNIAIHQNRSNKAILLHEAISLVNEDACLTYGLKELTGTYSTLDEIENFVKESREPLKMFFDSQKLNIAIKPRRADGILIQAATDAFTNCGKEKTRHNLIRVTGNHQNQMGTSYIPELIKRKLDLSQNEYTQRMQRILNANITSIDKIYTIDPELGKTLIDISRKYPVYEGIMHGEIMGVCVDFKTPSSSLSTDIIDYLYNHPDKRLIKIIDV